MVNKYQRRWFQLTSETLAYAKDPKELKDGGGKVEYFAIHEMQSIKRIDNDKIEVCQDGFKVF